MGPLITREHRDKVASYLDVATADGATVVVDGRGVEADGGADGFWLGPTLIDRVPLDSRVYTEEIFGPVLSVVRVASYEEGVAIINASPYGNGTAIFTNDGGAARRFQQEVQVGMIGINVPIPVPSATTPSAAGRIPCSATPRRTGPTPSTSSPGRRRSPRGGSTPPTGASTSGSPRTSPFLPFSGRCVAGVTGGRRPEYSSLTRHRNS